MDFESLKNLVLEGFSDAALFSDNAYSNAVFNAIRDMQEDAECSVADFDIVVATTTQKIILSNLVYKLEDGDFEFEDATYEALAHAVYVESVYDISQGEPGTKISFGNKNDFDRGDVYKSDFGAVGFDKSSMTMFFPYDLNGKTMRVRCRFVLDYVEGEFSVGTKTDLYLSSIPIQLRRYLVDGIQAYFYKTLFKDTGRKDFERKWQTSEAEWRVKKLPFAKQAVKNILTNDTIYQPKSPKIFRDDIVKY